MISSSYEYFNQKNMLVERWQKVLLPEPLVFLGMCMERGMVKQAALQKHHSFTMTSREIGCFYSKQPQENWWGRVKYFTRVLKSCTNFQVVYPSTLSQVGFFRIYSISRSPSWNNVAMSTNQPENLPQICQPISCPLSRLWLVVTQIQGKIHVKDQRNRWVSPWGDVKKEKAVSSKHGPCSNFETHQHQGVTSSK